MKIYIIGSGCHAGVVIEACNRLNHYIEGLLDDVNPIGTLRNLREVKGTTDMPIKYPDSFNFHIAIGENGVRQAIAEKKPKWRFASIKHPTALHLERQDCNGSFFAANSFIGNNSIVGNHTIINTGVILEHDSTVGDYSHLAPGVVTGGRVKIGNRTMIGLGCTVMDGVKIGNNAIVGMGSNVIRDIPDNTVWWGNPAEFHRENK